MYGRPLPTITHDDLVTLEHCFDKLHGPTFRKSPRHRKMTIWDIIAETEAVIAGGTKQVSTKSKGKAKEQLVVKYMAAENCRAGCLLITVNGAGTWQHPDTGDSLDFSELIGMLNADALKLEEDMGKSLLLAVYGLDLRPRLLPESATIKPKRKRPE